MRAAVEGTWRLSLDGRVTTLRITQGGQVDVHAARELLKSAAACGSRTLIQSANACMTDTRMPLHIVALAGPPLPVEGTFMVVSTKFTRGDLELTIGDAHVEARLLPDGTVLDAEAFIGIGPGNERKVSLQRISATSK
jgi:hypothetical protein